MYKVQSQLNQNNHVNVCLFWTQEKDSRTWTHGGVEVPYGVPWWGHAIQILTMRLLKIDDNKENLES